jgi:ketosteroid isomerase-like protein
MSDHPDASLYRRYVERLFVGGDLDSVSSILSEEVIWHEPGGTGAFVGRGPLLEQMRWVTSTFEVDVDIHDVLADGEHTVALVEWRISTGDRSLVSQQVEIWHVRDGVVVERWLFVDDLQAFVDFFTAVTG